MAKGKMTPRDRVDPPLSPGSNRPIGIHYSHQEAMEGGKKPLSSVLDERAVSKMVDIYYVFLC